MRRTRLVMSVIVICGWVAVRTLPEVQAADATASRQKDPVYRRAVVAADHPLASQAGLEILRQGGNVVDAAVATSFALSVVRPASCGIGGGGFMLIWDAEKKQSVALDYRERAPARARRDMFVDAKDGNQSRRQLSRRGHLASAVPGTVAGLCYALERYGSLELNAVMRPAIRLARDGVVPDTHTLAIQKTSLALFKAKPDDRQRFGTLYRQYLNDGRPWTTKDRFHSPQLRVLERIAACGADGFYCGPVAEALVAESRRGGGLLTLDDLAVTKPVVRRPVQGRFDGWDVLSMPPPSSGGIAVIEILNLLSEYEKSHAGTKVEEMGRRSPEYAHLLTEAMKHAFADRAEFLGDADVVKVPVERLVSRDYAGRLAARIDPAKTKPLKEYGRFLPVEDSGTSHFSIVDAAGNAVACTETINTRFGSYVVEPKYGIVLNNQMDDFAAVPGQPNAFGLVQSEANAVAAGKKPLSSMSPTIVLKAGRAVHVLGASGGPRIISSTLQVLLNLTRFGMSPRQAVAHPRIHHQWLPDEIYVERPLFQELRGPLEQRGHTVRSSSGLAAVQAASRSADGLRAASDPRKHGRPAGY